MSNSSYTISVIDTDDATLQAETRSRKDAATALADQLFADNPSMTVTVVTDAGTEVYRLNAGETETPEDDEVAQLVEANASEEVIAEAVSRRAKPWTKTVDKASFEIPEVEAFTPAYVRARTQTVVYRANDKSGLRVLDTRNGQAWDVENTTQARLITNRLEAEETTRRNEAKAQAKAKKVEAREVKAAERQAKQDAETAAKAARKAARDEAKRLRDEAKATKAEELVTA